MIGRNIDKMYYDWRLIRDYYIEFKNFGFNFLYFIFFVPKLFVLLFIFSLLTFYFYNSLVTLYKLVTVYFKWINTIYISEQIRFKKYIYIYIKYLMYSISIFIFCDLLLIWWSYVFVHLY